ncbi:MAG: iron complex outermembrane receptor protein [Saprospiraceae bacterium]|jgi:iron complex outermembrane receptor protein
MYAQNQVTGLVSDDSNEPLIGVNIQEKGTSNGAVTDIDGKYSINVAKFPATLVFSYIGYANQEIEVADATVANVTMSEGIGLGEVLVTGSRTAPRSSTDTPLPIDVVTAKDLIATGQNSFDKALTYKIPSFNSVNTPVNDATSLLDPYEIRNMGPSRTLILINGKRKNTSALLYTQTSPGRGETGADISAIPQGAIERVEILRDGASAQYGSDAIAGVMNIILKDDYNGGNVTFNTGITSAGDGETYGLALNNGSKIGETGFVNYTIDLSKRELANRPGTVDAEGEAGDFGADIADVEAFLADNPDAGNVNGSPETTAAKFSINTGIDISENSELYGNAAYVYKKVNSFANYRTPYWRTEAAFPYLADFFPNGENGEYVGYVPTFEGDLNDYNGTIGVRNTTNGWISDASFTVGGNKQTYIVSNSHNRSDVLNADGTNKYRENSPLVFDVGGTEFTHVVGNIDITKRMSDMFGLAFGSEFRSENFSVLEGSVSAYEGGGPDSFSGTDPRNAGKFNRYNLGAYADFAFDFTDDFLVNATIRGENYSDFGSAFVWKVSSRYKMADDKVTLRASASTGFRAPLLHQIYTQKAQYSFVPGQGIQVGGLINNVSREARLLGLASLTPEKSTNITVGIGVKPNNQFSFTLDYYNIAVEDRVILSSEIGATETDADGNNIGTTILDDILRDNNISDLSFFANAMDTRTSGIDFVANYRNVSAGSGNLNFNLSGNYMIQNERIGDVKNPQVVTDANVGLPADQQQSISNSTQEALFFTSRPKFKGILGINYKVGALGLSLNNTVFGPTTFRQQGLAPGIYTEFMTKLVTDLSVSYAATDKVTLALNVNNLLNVLPEWEFKADSDNAVATANLNDEAYMKNQSNLITFNQRYSQMTYDGYHFSQLGTMLNFSVNIQF